MNKQELIREIAGCVEEYGSSINVNIEMPSYIITNVDETTASVIYPSGDEDDIWLEDMPGDELEDILMECESELEDLEKTMDKCGSYNY